MVPNRVTNRKHYMGGLPLGKASGTRGLLVVLVLDSSEHFRISSIDWGIRKSEIGRLLETYFIASRFVQISSKKIEGPFAFHFEH